MRSLILIDSYAQIFRGYFAVRVLTSHDGTPTNAVFAMESIRMRERIGQRGMPTDGGSFEVKMCRARSPGTTTTQLAVPLAIRARA